MVRRVIIPTGTLHRFERYFTFKAGVRIKSPCLSIFTAIN